MHTSFVARVGEEGPLESDEAGRGETVTRGDGDLGDPWGDKPVESLLLFRDHTISPPMRRTSGGGVAERRLLGLRAN